MALRNVLRDIIESERGFNQRKESQGEIKERLKRQINELKSVIVQMEWCLNILTFGQIKHTDIPHNFNSISDAQISNINIILKNQLHSYAGFYCTKFTKEEFVFNFLPSNKYNKDDIYAIQLINKNGEISLGNWNMPISIDLEDLITIFPIKESNGLCSFLKTCKHYIDCHFLRQKQYNELMETVSHVNNCHLQTNLGYTQFMLEVMGIYDEKDNVTVDIEIYIVYNIDNIRPHKVEVDSKTTDVLQKHLKKQLKTSLECFKKHDLHTAFKKLLNNELLALSKKAEEDDNSLLRSSLSSLDEESYLEEFPSQSKRLSLKPKKKKRKMKNMSKDSSQGNLKKKMRENEELLLLGHDEQKSKSFHQNSASQKDTNVKPKTDVTKLKQTTLNFELDNAKSKIDNNEPLKKSVPQISIIKKKVNNLHTSTPIRFKNTNSKAVSSSSIDISDITNVEDIPRNGKTKDNVESTGKKELQEKYQPFSNTSIQTQQKKKKIKSMLQKKKFVL